MRECWKTIEVEMRAVLTSLHFTHRHVAGTPAEEAVLDSIERLQSLLARTAYGMHDEPAAHGSSDDLGHAASEA